MGAALRLSSAGETVGVGAMVCVVVGGCVAVAAGGGVTLGGNGSAEGITVAVASGIQATKRKASKTTKAARIIHCIIWRLCDCQLLLWILLVSFLLHYPADAVEAFPEVGEGNV